MRPVKFLEHWFFWTIHYHLLPHPKGAFHKIDETISSLPNVQRGKHLYGSIEWRYKNKPIGHIHGNRIVDILFPKEVRTNLLLNSKIVPNKYAKNGISVHLNDADDIQLAIKLLIQSYNLVKSKTDKHEGIQQQLVSI